MKTTTEFQLGGVAVLLSALLTGFGRLIYFLSGQPAEPIIWDIWRGILAGTLFLLSFGALFARQSQRGGTLGLVGYIFIMLAQTYFVGSDAVSLGVSEGVISQEQILQVQSYVLLDSMVPWVWVAGLLAFGISIYRAEVFPQYAGVLLIVLGLIQPLAGSLAFIRPIYALLYVTAWAWLGWDLYAKASTQADERLGLQHGAAANTGR